MKKVLALLLTAAMLASMAACGKAEPAAAAAEPETEAVSAQAETTVSEEIKGVEIADEVSEEKTYKEHVDMSVWSNVKSLDPMVFNAGAGIPMYNMYMNQLLDLDEENNVFIPELAEEWTVVDLNTISFKLKQGIKFHNGEELTSDDVLFSFVDRPATVEEATATFQNKIDNIEIIDDYNFIIHLNQPDPEYLYSLVDVWASILNREACEASEDGYLVGTGGYKVTEWSVSDKLSLEKFDDSYVWAEEGTTPTRTVTMRCMTEGSIAAVQAGDVANALCEKEDVESYLAADENVETAAFRTWGYWMLGMNHHEGSIFYDDDNLLKAVVAAFDRDLMAQFYAGNNAMVPDSFFPDYMYGYTNQYEFAKFDPDAAKEYLAASKHPDGDVTIRVLTNTNANYTSQVTVLQSILESNLGVKVDVQQLDKAGRTEAIQEGTSYDIYMLDVTAGLNGSKFQNRFELGSANDWANYANEEIDQCYIDYLSTDDETVQKEKLARVQEIVAQDYPYVPYAYMITNVVMAKGVSGLNWKASTKFDFHRVVWEEN